MSKTEVKTVRILLVDDHTLFRESVARLLQAEPGLEVVAHCGSSVEALRILESRDVDIVLLDVDLGQESGTNLLESLGEKQSKAKVLVVTAGVNESEVPTLIRKGVAGIFLKHASPTLLIQAIREVMQGRALFGQDLLRRAFENTERLGAQQAPARLTERERHVLSFIFEGLANKQIADRLKVSESAVKSCLQQLFSKTGVRTRSQLVRVALEQYRNQL
jgi:two-component system, NarL family, nitrate/nitrite response regulator NarL